MWVWRRAAGFVRPRERGSLNRSLRRGLRLIDAGLTASVGDVGYGYGNALTERVKGRRKREGFGRRPEWPRGWEVQWATHGWVDW